MSLSKSKYCKGIQCKKMLWLEKYKPDEKENLNNDSILQNGNDIHEIAKYLFGNHINIGFNEDLNKMLEDTEKALKNKNVIITEASFNYKNNFCSVDILKKDNDEYEVYEVKGSTKLKDIYIKDVSYQLYVLKNLGFNIKRCYLVHLNSDYVRNGELDLNELFIKEDITNVVYNLQDEVIDNIENINKYMEQVNEPNDDIDNKCFSPYPCAFFKYCTRNLPENNIFKVRGMHNTTKIKFYKNGIYKYEDLLKEKIKDLYKQQIEYELYSKNDYINIDEIKKFMDTVSYPIYFLDFETFQMTIPKYDGISPYMQVPFQYSLHIKNLDDSLIHKEFLADAGVDPRRMLAERLVNDIPLNSCTVAYNMSFEKNVIKNLAGIYPDLSEHLMNIHDNMIDLMIPFKNRSYYTKNMYGSYSIKYVLPALFPNDESLDYHNLDLIHNGGEAMSSFASLEEKSVLEQEYIRERLLKYCELDTYAMVKIFDRLNEILQERNGKVILKQKI